MSEVLERPAKTTALDRILKEVRRLGLEENILELEANGYTTLRGVLTADQIRQARAAIIARAERIASRPVDADTETGEGFTGMRYIPYLLYDDPVFEEILMAPAPLALITWLLGESCLLSSIGCHFRGPGGAPLMLHSDNGNGIPPPFPAHAQVANVNYALTPYSREAGALAMVPASHRLARQPTAAENFRIEGLTPGETAACLKAGGPFEDTDWADPPGIVAMDLEPGDAVVWHGNTWHGSFRRELAGVRMNLAVYFNRQFVQTQERHKGVTPSEVLGRHAGDERFLTLLGAKQPYGWQTEGPDYALMARNPRGLYD
ncbi:MAG TPA: phytanoyl-CoA dioxygenase family protein [Caulobacteraceae bacterium]|nr:phytanoyl-CoA dioxygenase family protein [Caulobacteraceae bacterium]